jgi:putative flippase GtrA
MQTPTAPVEPSNHEQAIRYIINGVVATAVHFAALSFNLHIVGVHSVGLANLMAAVAGISTSFLGSRYFVFRSRAETIFRQATKFGLLYALIAGLHGFVLHQWSDIWQFDYRIGFLFATALQMALSYWGNKILVFKH